MEMILVLYFTCFVMLIAYAPWQYSAIIMGACVFFLLLDKAGR